MWGTWILWGSKGQPVLVDNTPGAKWGPQPCQPSVQLWTPHYLPFLTALLSPRGSSYHQRDCKQVPPQPKGQTCGSYKAETGPSLSASLEQVDQVSRNDGNPSLPTTNLFLLFHFPPPSPAPSSFLGFCLFLHQVSSLPIDSKYFYNKFPLA